MIIDNIDSQVIPAASLKVGDILLRKNRMVEVMRVAHIVSDNPWDITIWFKDIQTLKPVYKYTRIPWGAEVEVWRLDGMSSYEERLKEQYKKHLTIQEYPKVAELLLEEVEIRLPENHYKYLLIRLLQDVQKYLVIDSISVEDFLHNSGVDELEEMNPEDVDYDKFVDKVVSVLRDDASSEIDFILSEIISKLKPEAILK